ncbi:MAG: hypothetical protein Q7R41_20130 [Phycisphaerales bacterium]|nr:hypothetical protein [Phycisphaerales bacterium]
MNTCDEFEGVVDVTRSAHIESPRMAERFVVANREQYPGLCVTCTKRDTCTFPKPEGGVFNCDEFE